MAYLSYPKMISELIKITELEGWKKATLDFLRKTDEGLYRQATDDSLIDWRYLLPIDKESLVLDFGCGLGMTSIVLSQLSKAVISLDNCYENIKFLKLKLKQENIRNVYPVLISDSFNLPLVENCFDIIIIGRIERNFQEEAIEIFSRLLGPKGVLFFRVENRPFQKVSNNGLFRLSYRQVLATLRKIGFYDTNLFFPFPGDTNIQAIVPLKNLQLLNYYFTNVRDIRRLSQKVKYRFLQLFIKSKTLRYFLPYFYVITAKT